MKITAAVAREKGRKLSLEEIDIESPRPDEILVKLVATGVCHTDIITRNGLMPTPFPVVLGHEGAGVVEAVGESIKKVRRGDKVVMTFNSCGFCPNCQEYHITYCHNKTAICAGDLKVERDRPRDILSQQKLWRRARLQGLVAGGPQGAYPRYHWPERCG